MDMLEKRPVGGLYLLEKNRKLRKVLSGVSISNGLGWSPDNKIMYYIDTPTRKVSAFDYHLDSGEIENRRTVVDFLVQQQLGSPDGMAVDAEGMIWVAHWGGSRVTRWDPQSGKLLEMIQIPALQVSSCCFGGKNLDDLYITTARNGLDQKILDSQPLTGALFKVRPGVQGLPTNAFDG
jgi:sugar lactone lactonase YvrE